MNRRCHSGHSNLKIAVQRTETPPLAPEKCSIGALPHPSVEESQPLPSVPPQAKYRTEMAGRVKPKRKAVASPRPTASGVIADGAQQRIPADGPVVISGGAGFIGANLARRLLAARQPVRLFDNLSRAGVAHNLAWLRRVYGEAVVVELGDIRDYKAVEKALRDAAAVFHCAAQVAVTSSLARPHEDFAVNAEGTLNLLEALRNQSEPPPLLFTSTNKVMAR